jgi:hypothetical protein
MCTEKWKSLDPFGWSTALLHNVRGITSSVGQTFFQLMGTLISRIANTQIPDLASFILTTGSLFGLYKETEETRSEKEKKGIAPKERPINQGSLFLQVAFDLALGVGVSLEVEQNLWCDAVRKKDFCGLMESVLQGECFSFAEFRWQCGSLV